MENSEKSLAKAQQSELCYEEVNNTGNVGNV